ncbi:MAG: hypothetical protein AB7I18_14550 [Candidatus Berkiella sp.]
MKFKKLLFLALLLQSFSVHAHECKACDLSHRWWVNLGMGVGTAFNSGDNTAGGSAAQLSFNGMITNNLFITLESTGMGRDYSREAHDVGLLLGYKSRRPNWYWSIGAGIAHYEYETMHSWWNSRNYRYSSGAAMPVQGQLFWTPVKHLGIGLIGHAVVSKDSYGVALLGLQIS